MVRVDDLASIPLFAGLEAAQLAELAGWLAERTVAEGTRLTGEGDAGYTFFVLAEGTAAVTAEGEHLRALGRGDSFGELAIVGDGRRTATVTTTSPARVFVMFGTEFRQLEQRYPEVAERILALTR